MEHTQRPLSVQVQKNVPWLKYLTLYREHLKADITNSKGVFSFIYAEN